MRRWVPQLWGGGGRKTMRTLPEFGLVLLAMTLGVIVYSLIRTAFGELIIPDETLSLAIGRGTRSPVGHGHAGDCSGSSSVGGWPSRVTTDARRSPGPPGARRSPPWSERPAAAVGSTATSTSSSTP